MLVCRHCHQQNPPEQRSCARCGRSLTAEPREATPTTMYGVRPIAEDDALAGPHRMAAPSRTSFGIHVLDDEDPLATADGFGLSDEPDGSIRPTAAGAMPAGGATMHGGSLAAILGPESGPATPVGEAGFASPGFANRGRDLESVSPGRPASTSTMYGRSPLAPARTGPLSSVPAPPVSQLDGSVSPRPVSSGSKTSLGIAALTSDSDPVQPIGGGGLALDDDWLDDIQSFIDEKVADGTLAIPGGPADLGVAPTASGSQSVSASASAPASAPNAWTARSATAPTVSSSASAAVPAPEGSISSDRELPTAPLMRADVLAATTHEPEDSADAANVAGFGIVRKRRTKRANSVSTGPVATAGTSDRASLGRDASAGQMRDRVEQSGVAEMSAAVIGAGTESNVPLRFSARPEPSDRTQPGRPVRDPRDVLPYKTHEPSPVPESGRATTPDVPYADVGEAPESRAGQIRAVTPVGDATTDGAAKQLGASGAEAGIDEGVARTMAFSPEAALQVARAAGQSPTGSGSGSALADFVRDADDSGAAKVPPHGPAAPIEPAVVVIPAKMAPGSLARSKGASERPLPAKSAPGSSVPFVVWVALAIAIVVLAFVVSMALLG